MVALKELALATLKKLSKATLDKIKLKIVNTGKDAAIILLANLITSKTGLPREISIRVSTIIVNKIIREIKEKAKSNK